MLAHLPLDAIADQFGTAFLADRLPPVLAGQAPAAGAGAGAAADGGGQSAGGEGSSATQVTEGSLVRLAAPGIARLVISEDEEAPGEEPEVRVHHCLANGRAAHAARRRARAECAGAEGGRPPRDEVAADQEAAEEGGAGAAAGVLEFPLGCAEVVDILLSAGSGAPGSLEAVPLSQLPEPEECELSALDVAQALADAGVLVAVEETPGVSPGQ